MDSKVLATFWLDPDLDEEGAEVRTTLLWFMTNPLLNPLGVFTAAKTQFAQQTRLGAEWFERGLEVAKRMDMVVVDEKKVWLRNFIGIQIGRGPALARNNMTKALVKPFASASPVIQKAVLKEYPELASAPSPLVALLEGCESPSGLGSASGNSGKEGASAQGLPKPQRRTEQNSSEQRGESRGGTLKRELQPFAEEPSEAEVIAAGTMIGLSEAEARKFYQHYAGLGWMHGQTRIADWRKWLPKWRETARQFSKKAGASGAGATQLRELEAALEREVDPSRREAIRKQIKALE